MTLLTMLRPANTFGRGDLTAEEQHTLLRLATNVGDRETLRMLASMPNLTGEARTTLLADRSQDIRRRVLSRADLTDAELTSLLAEEKRATVLAALSEKADDAARERLVRIAADKNSVTLAEALLSRAALDREQKIRMTHILIDGGRAYMRLTTAAMRAVEGCAADAKTLRWASAAARHGTASYHVTRLIQQAAEGTENTDTLRANIEAIAAAEAWERVDQYLTLTLEGERKALSSDRQNGRYDADALLTLVGELPDLLARAGAPSGTCELGRALASSIRLILGQDETPARKTADIDYATVTGLDSIIEEYLAAMAGEELVELACNPNHTSETSWALATEIRRRKSIAAALILRYDKIDRSIWEALRGGLGGGDGSTAAEVLARVGHTTLVAALNSDAFRHDDKQHYYWRPNHPLIGNPSTLAWVLEGEGVNPELDQVALDLPVKEFLRAEASAYKLIHRQIGDNLDLWDAVNRLAANWEGTFRELIATAEGLT